jgi:hypothetical protein
MMRDAALKTTLVIIATLLFAYIALLLTFNSAVFQDWLRLELARQTGHEIGGELRLDPLLRLNASAVSVSKAGKAVFQAKRARMIITPLSLFYKNLHRLYLEKPTLYLELNELMKENNEPGLNVSFRHLNIHDGALVLKVGGDHSLEFRSLTMNAENIDLGHAAGLNLRAEVPGLQGFAQLDIWGDEKQKTARLGIRQAEGNIPGMFLQSKPRLRDALEAEIKFTKKPDESLRLALAAKFNNLVIGDGGFSGSFDGRADIDRDRDRADVQITGKKLLAGPKSQMPVAAEDLRITGTLEQKANAPARAAGQLRINQARFASLDGARIGENLTIAGRFEIGSRPDLEGISFNGRLDLQDGEILWEKFFADMKSQQPSLRFDVDYVSGADALRLRELSLTLAGVGRVVTRGVVEQTSKNPLLRLELKSDDVQPGGIFEYFVRPTLNRSFPVLDQLAVGGQLAFAVKANGTLDDLILEGAIQLRGAELQNKVKNWQLGPMQLDLPLRIQYPGASSPAEMANVPSGTLTISRARLGSETLPTVKTTVSFWNNALKFREAIRLPIYGGVLEISDLAFRNLIEEPQAVSLALEAKNLRLERLTEALGWYPFGGTLSGSIPKIESDGGALRSEGKIQVEVFGGRVQISTLEIQSPFSSIPSIKLDARFRNISLDQASRTFAFGQILGILEGTVNDLVLTAGQPSEFRADVHSVEKRGVSQRISVESLNKITVLSSGNDAGALYSGIASFFDTFRYSKLGFKAALKNDKLTLRGVESRKDGEYLVVGSFIPPTVNVISHTQVIAFSELLRRLEQVQQSGDAEKSGK